MSYYDDLIEELLLDNYYDIRIDGTIWGCFAPKSGARYSNYNINKLRRMDRINKTINRYVVSYERKLLQASRIIYRKYIDKLDPFLEIDHKDNNSLNNNPNNLQLVTSRENKRLNADRDIFKGIKNPRNILTENDVRDIKIRLANNESQASIARLYDVSTTMIYYIKTGVNWSHII